MEFLRETFPYLQNLRPGNWTILQLGNNNKLKTSDFAQYEHLAYLNALTTQNAQLAAAPVSYTHLAGHSAPATA